MLEVLKIYKDDISTEKLWGHILIDSYNFSYEKYDYSDDLDFHRLDLFWKTINQDFVYIVLKQNKAIGFLFFIEEQQTISFRLFVYSRACPMSLRSLLKSALFKIMLDYTKKGAKLKDLNFSTWHPSLVSLIKMYLPDLKVNMYSPSDMECTRLFTQDDYILFDKILTKNIYNYETISDYDNFKIVV